MSTNKPWDIIPGELLCREMGIYAKYLDFDGNIRLYSNNKDINNILLD